MNLQEDYCSYELSKLLKEKGFDWNCHQYDFEDWKKRHSTITSIRPYNFNEDDKCISIPTHQMALKWLREYPRYIFIGIDNQYIFSYEVYHYHIRCKAPKREIDKVSKVDYRTYEEAVEAAIKYTLENLV